MKKLCFQAFKALKHFISSNFFSILFFKYGDLSTKYKDLSKDEVLVQFFSEVLARRDQLSPGVGEDTTVRASSVPCVQNKHPMGSNWIDPAMKYIYIYKLYFYP